MQVCMDSEFDTFEPEKYDWSKITDHNLKRVAKALRKVCIFNPNLSLSEEKWKQVLPGVRVALRVIATYAEVEKDNDGDCSLHSVTDKPTV